jgi:uncharacterized protein (UPF0248 family)
MIPIQDLLNRIRWDESFSGDFVLGYYDRVTGEIARVPLAEITFPPDDHFAFVVVDEECAAHSAPYHRVRKVWRNGELIWRRAT